MACSSTITSSLLSSYKELIKVFSKCPIDIQQLLIANPSLKSVKLVSELSINLLYNTTGLSENCIRDLKKYKKLILYFSDRKIPLSSKKRTLKKIK